MGIKSEASNAFEILFTPYGCHKASMDTIPIRIEAKKGPKLLIIKTLGDLSLLNHLLNISN